MIKLNEVKLSGEVYSDVKQGTAKNGQPWSAFKLKVMNGNFYSLIPIYAPGQATKASKGDSISVYGELVEQYRANKSDPIQFQVKANMISGSDDRGSNPELDDSDLAF